MKICIFYTILLDNCIRRYEVWSTHVWCSLRNTRVVIRYPIPGWSLYNMKLTR